MSQPVERRGLGEVFLVNFKTLRQHCGDDPAKLRQLKKDSAISLLCEDLFVLHSVFERHVKGIFKKYITPVSPTFVKEWRNYEANWAEAIMDVVLDVEIDLELTSGVKSHQPHPNVLDPINSPKVYVEEFDPSIDDVANCLDEMRFIVQNKLYSFRVDNGDRELYGTGTSNALPEVAMGVSVFTRHYRIGLGRCWPPLFDGSTHSCAIAVGKKAWHGRARRPLRTARRCDSSIHLRSIPIGRNHLSSNYGDGP